MELTRSQREIQGAALQYAKNNKQRIARELTDKSVYIPEDNPVSVFMAGSPGAGKTEASIALLESIDGVKILRIDPDELRQRFDGYTGDNSFLFHRAVSILVERIHDFALNNKQSFLLDGTLSKFDVAVGNIDRSLRKERHVQILYVYQDPLQAWRFVLAREKAEGRRIMPETFINQYFKARDVVNRLKEKYGRDIQIDLIHKNNDGTNRVYRDNIDKIDNHIPEKYTRAALEPLIQLS